MSQALDVARSVAKVASAMPGDELVPEPSFSATRAITIQAPPEQVWLWIVQLGTGRAGFYSYDLFDWLLWAKPHSTWAWTLLGIRRRAEQRATQPPAVVRP